MATVFGYSQGTINQSGDPMNIYSVEYRDAAKARDESGHRADSYATVIAECVADGIKPSPGTVAKYRKARVEYKAALHHCQELLDKYDAEDRKADK